MSEKISDEEMQRRKKIVDAEILEQTTPTEFMDAWMKKAIVAHKRMTEDEEYRKEIAKRLF